MFCPDGNSIASASFYDIKVWDLASGRGLHGARYQKGTDESTSLRRSARIVRPPQISPSARRVWGRV